LRAPSFGYDGLMLKFENSSRANFETLKALANFSPGLRFGNPGVFCSPLLLVATLKELRPIEVTNLIPGSKLLRFQFDITAVGRNSLRVAT